ncbi:MAG: hypothetical protein ACE5F1_09835 [Planctomycetota bacterium]
MHECGSSLIELMIGSSFVAAVLIAIVYAVVRLSGLRRVDQELDMAFVACRNNLEELRNLPFTQVPAMQGVGFDVPSPGGSPGGLTPLPGDADGLPGRFTVVVDKQSGGEILYNIIVAVDWKGVSGRQHFELRSLMAERKGQ